MGQTQSKSRSHPFAQSFHSTHRYLQDTNDTRFGPIKLYQNVSGDRIVAVKRNAVNSRDQMQEMIDHSILPAINNKDTCPFLLKIYDWEIAEEKNVLMCGGSSDFHTYHEYYSNNLETEVTKRNKRNLFFTEEELWIILYSLISASAFLEKYGKRLDDIRPATIFLTEQGHVKLTPFGLFWEDQSVFQQYYLNSAPGLFSPEQCQELQSRTMKSTTNAYHNETYQIALTLLSCATLVSANTCYDYSVPEIKEEVIDFYLNNIAQYYGKFFCNLIKLMLSQDLLYRPSPSLIATILAPYETEILSLQRFTPDLEVLKQTLENKGAVPSKRQSEVRPSNRQPQPQQQQAHHPTMQQESQPVYYPQQQQQQPVYQPLPQQQQQPPIKNVVQVVQQPAPPIAPQQQPIYKAAPQQPQYPQQNYYDPVPQVVYVEKMPQYKNESPVQYQPQQPNYVQAPMNVSYPQPSPPQKVMVQAPSQSYYAPPPAQPQQYPLNSSQNYPSYAPRQSDISPFNSYQPQQYPPYNPPTNDYNSYNNNNNNAPLRDLSEIDSQINNVLQRTQDTLRSMAQ